MSDHLVPLPGTGWQIWREFAIRGAGFPVDGLEPLSISSYARAADALALARGDGDGAPPGELARLEQVLRTEAQHGLEQEVDALRKIARDPLFREAITWQNRDVRRWAVDLLAATTPGAPRNVRLRHRSKAVAKYWQRYCTKNDTIGFFGPVCWGSVLESGDPITARPGPGLVRRRIAFLEHWCVEAYAKAVAADPGVRVWLSPRPLVHHHLEGRTVHRPPQPPVLLGRAGAGVLALCDGRRTAQAIAREAVADGSLGLRQEADALLVLDDLVQQKLITWEFSLPIGPPPEEALRRQLERIEDEALRAKALAGLARLEQGRDAVAAAAGDVDALDEALDRLEQVFTELTGEEPSRQHGKTYAGRTLVFEDTYRDLDVDLGPGFLETIAPALDLLLTGARWLCVETARAYKEAFKEAFETERVSGQSVVELGQLWPWVQAMLFGSSRRPIDDVMDEFRRRWARVLHLDGDVRRLQRTSGELREQVAAEFAAEGRLWPDARYHSPDLQIDAASLEAIGRGEYQVVLGELHTAWNTVDSWLFVTQHPEPGRLLAYVDADHPDSRVLPLLPSDWPRTTRRTINSLIRDHDLQLGWIAAPPPAAGQLLPLGELLVEEADGELRVRTRDGRLTLDPLEFIGPFLSVLVVDAYKSAFSAEGSDHVPRTSIDKLVISRETWRMPVAELDFAEASDEVVRFAGARAWRLRHDLPEQIFCMFTHETKPFGVDLRSPVQVEVLVEAARAALRRDGPQARVSVSEMLPGPSGSWLPDAAGRRYVSELRLQLVDPA
jgi:hypothetical protein